LTNLMNHPSMSEAIAFDAEGNLIYREQDLHIVVDGAFCAGKSSFIQTIAEYTFTREVGLGLVTGSEPDSEPNPLFEALKDIKINLFCGIGRINVDDDVALYFHERDNRRRPLIELIENQNLLGAVILVDSAKHETFREMRSILETFRAYSPAPYVVVGNKQNLPDALPIDYVRERLFLTDDVPVMPCDSTQKESVKTVLIALLEKVIEAIDAPDETETLV
jgi:signal recognition particle receptor subunit beta